MFWKLFSFWVIHKRIVNSDYNTKVILINLIIYLCIHEILTIFAS